MARRLTTTERRARLARLALKRSWPFVNREPALRWAMPDWAEPPCEPCPCPECNPVVHAVGFRLPACEAEEDDDD